MKNYTLLKFLLLFTILFFTVNSNAQFFKKHYIAPAPWNYFSNANEIVVATESLTQVSAVLTKSDGTAIVALSVTKGTPAVYRFVGSPIGLGQHALNTVLNGVGIYVNCTAPVSVNLRNVASDFVGAPNTIPDGDIKGNASLTSFGDAGIGVKFRIGYYRDGVTAASAGGYVGPLFPVYTVLAINNATSVTINGVASTTLNAGQSYAFRAPIGTLVETSAPSVMNTNSPVDAPGGCGDGVSDQIAPITVLGTEYFIVRGQGNSVAEQTSLVATLPNTTLTLEKYLLSGAFLSTQTITLANAGDFYQFINGDGATPYSASRVLSNKKIAVYSGTAITCEVDMTTIAPVSPCAGSKFVETRRFTRYSGTILPYYAYVLLRSSTDIVNVKIGGVDTNLESIAGVGVRRQLGTTGWYLIDFTNVNISDQPVITLSSVSKLTVSLVQQGGGFSMSAIFSNFTELPDTPTALYSAGSGCTNFNSTLTTTAGFAPYQWFFNDVAIPGAINNTYLATNSGSYTVSATLSCGAIVASSPVNVILCTDVSVTKTVNNSAPLFGTAVIFTITATNNGPNNATGVSVTDLLGTGYTYQTSIAPQGTSYNPTSGLWSIGGMSNGQTLALTVTAFVNATGSYANTATINSAEQPDNNSANNTQTVTPVPVSSALSSDISVTKTVDIAAPAFGGTVIFTIIARNLSTSTNNATGIVVTDILPSGYTYVSNTAGQGTFNSATGIWTVGSLNINTASTLTITATVNTTGNYLNTSTIYGAQPDPVFTNNTSSIETIPGVNANLQITKVASNAAPLVGSNVTFTVTVTNLGPSPATNVTVTDPLPTGYSLVSAPSSLVIGNLGVGGSAVLTFIYTVLPTGIYANIASVSSAQPDSNTANNSATSTPVPNATSANLSIVKTVNINAPTVGSTVIFTLTVNNTGPAAATSVTAQDLLPSGYAYSSHVASVGTYVSGTGVWTIGTINSGAAAVTLNITCVVQPSGNYTNAAVVSSTIPDPVPANNTSILTPSGLVLPTFACTEKLYITKQAGANTELGNFLTVANDFNIGTVFTYNNVLLNGSVYFGGYIWAFEANTNKLYRLANNGNTYSYSVVAGLPSAGWNNAGVTSIGKMFMFANNSFQLFQIDLLAVGGPALVSSTTGNTVTIVGGGNTGDIAANAIWGDIVVDPTNNDKYVWYQPTAINTTPGLYKLDSNTNLITLVGSSVQQSMESLFFDEAGGLYSYGATTLGGTQNILFSINKTTGVLTTVGTPDITVTQTDGCNCAYGAGITLASPVSLNYNNCTTNPFNFTYGLTNSTGAPLTGATVSHTLDPRFKITATAASIQTILIPVFGATPVVTITSSGGGTNNVLTITGLTIPVGTNFFNVAVAQVVGATFTSGETISNTAVLGGLAASLGVTDNSNNPNTLIPNDPTAITMNFIAPVSPGVLSGTQAVCLGSTTTFTSTVSGGTWSSSNIAIATIGSSTGIITSVSAGTTTMTYSVPGTGGCPPSTVTGDVTVTASPVVPTFTQTAASCSAAATTTISNFSAANAYTFSPTGPTVSGTGLISGATAGTTYLLTVNSVPACTPASANFTNATQLVTPASPTFTTVAATCSAAGSSSISNFSAANTYTFIPSGPTVGALGAISNATAGTTYGVTSTNASLCISASANFTNATQLVTPASPTFTTVAAACSAAGSSSIANYSAVNSYTFTPSGPTVNATGNIANATAGTTYSVTSSNASLCVSASANFTNATQLVTPASPTFTTVAATCSAAGSSSIANYSAANTYTFTPSGPTVGATGLISGATAGTTYGVTSTNASLCVSSSANFTNATQLVTPASPLVGLISAINCAAGTTSLSLSGLPSGSWTISILPNTAGVSGLSGATASTVLTGLSVGQSYSIVVSNSVGCPSIAVNYTIPICPTLTISSPTAAEGGTETLFVMFVP